MIARHMFHLPQRLPAIPTGGRNCAQPWRERMLESTLMDTSAYARKIEAAYRSMWVAWCERDTSSMTTVVGRTKTASRLFLLDDQSGRIVNPIQERRNPLFPQIFIDSISGAAEIAVVVDNDDATG